MKAVFLDLALLVASSVAGPLLGRSTSLGKRELPSPELIRNGAFTNGTYGWVIQPAAAPQDGRLCVSITANATNASVSTSYKFLETKNDVYTLNFTAAASVGMNIRVQTPDPPLDPNLDATAALTTTLHPFSFTYSPANQAPNATLLFSFNGTGVPAQVCFTDITLERINRSGFVQNTGPLVKVNQLGYLPNGPKYATIANTTNSTMGWQLLDGTGKMVMEGQTTPRGYDVASGTTVSTLNFTSYITTGTNFTLTTTNGSTSFPFSISSTLYDTLREDSLRFFYQQRSGIAIDGDLVGTQYARAAGHVQVPPNQGDVAVPCQRTSDAIIAYGEPWSCNYTLNVTQGWYDAGDQGKYVVNGGISSSQLLMAYERRLHNSDVISGALGDGALLIPERSNGIPDILDEANWELSFLLKMQVPANSPPQLVNGSMMDLSGMVHHKMHDNQWTPLPTDPSQDNKRRELHRPSTAATLNLAATAAMGSRLYAKFNQAYSQQLLSISKTAYAAAKSIPKLYAPGTDWDLGGGAYNDNDVTDEFYWAAAELYITTGDQQYASDVQSNPWHTANLTATFEPAGFSWGSVQALARLDLATVPNNLTDRSRIVQTVLDGANEYLQIQQTQAYGLPLTVYPWGSNSNNLNNVQVLATAYDLTGNATFRSAALEGIDYNLGRNALAQSYIREYGTKFVMNHHSRLYAHELNSAVPMSPPGAMSGGANSAPSDPPADDVLVGCQPQLCYVDDVNSYSTNEVAINWNSALAWVAAWAADQGASTDLV
ncbi:Glycoside hydrolase, 9 [Xylographa bjoerkii]|nr:Glycoside hydrolase, 9 [Xylographa bjoerkii]